MTRSTASCLLTTRRGLPGARGAGELRATWESRDRRPTTPTRVGSLSGWQHKRPDGERRVVPVQLYRPLLAVVDMCTARERTRSGDRDGAMPLLREVVHDLFRAGQLWSCIGASALLVETLLERGARDDVAEAEAAIDRLADTPADDGLVICEIWLLRPRALLARTHGAVAAYADFRDRYRDVATSLGYEGHMEWAGAMT
jgi:hypothetical protein